MLPPWCPSSTFFPLPFWRKNYQHFWYNFQKGERASKDWKSLHFGLWVFWHQGRESKSPRRHKISPRWGKYHHCKKEKSISGIPGHLEVRQRKQKANFWFAISKDLPMRGSGWFILQHRSTILAHMNWLEGKRIEYYQIAFFKRKGMRRSAVSFLQVIRSHLLELSNKYLADFVQKGISKKRNGNAWIDSIDSIQQTLSRIRSFEHQHHRFLRSQK